MKQSRAFTLIEIVIAMGAAALILIAVYSLFSKAVHLRDNATEKVREARLRSRAAFLIRNDLRNALISGTLASRLQGSQKAYNSNFPGYLTFTTTTARITSDALVDDVQAVEYFVENDPDAPAGKGGMLVRTIDTNLLAPTHTEPTPVPVLSGVKAMDVSFFDGQDWQDEWEVTDSDTTLPQAVRVTLEFADAQPPIDLLVPWTTRQQSANIASTTGTSNGGPQ